MLLRTSKEIEGIKNLINEYFYTDKIELKENGKNIWDIYKGDKLLTHYKVKFKLKKYRFENDI